MLTLMLPLPGNFVFTDERYFVSDSQNDIKYDIGFWKIIQQVVDLFISLHNGPGFHVDLFISLHNGPGFDLRLVIWERKQESEV